MEPANHDNGQVDLTPISVRIREAVRMTGLSRSRIYKLMRDGDVKYAKAGRATLILVESLKAYVLAHQVGE